MYTSKEEQEKYFSKKYNKNITFSNIYQDPETLQFFVDVLVDGVKTEDKDLVNKIKQENIHRTSKAINYQQQDN